MRMKIGSGELLFEVYIVVKKFYSIINDVHFLQRTFAQNPYEYPYRNMIFGLENFYLRFKNGYKHIFLSYIIDL